MPDLSDPRGFLNTMTLLEQETLETYDRDALMGAQLHMFLDAWPAEIAAWVALGTDRAAMDQDDHRTEEDFWNTARFLQTIAKERFVH